jgi:ribosomal-protein-alanine N-acetyltransferase
MRTPFKVDTMVDADIAGALSMQEATQLDAEQLRDELARPWSRVWVAREVAQQGAEVVALLVAWHVSDELHVLNVATRADRRRRGAARALLDALLSYAREKGARHVLLEVRRSNSAAIALYRGVGFFAMGLRARYYPDDEDAVEMALALDGETGAVIPRPDEIHVE